eukprot:8511684-Pyramimonas_sp.AAC.1
MYPAKRAIILLPPATVLARALQAFRAFESFELSSSSFPAMASPKASSPLPAENNQVIELLKENTKTLEQ